jgi:hypothetical protein
VRRRLLEWESGGRREKAGRVVLETVAHSVSTTESLPVWGKPNGGCSRTPAEQAPEGNPSGADAGTIPDGVKNASHSLTRSASQSRDWACSPRSASDLPLMVSPLSLLVHLTKNQLT